MSRFDQWAARNTGAWRDVDGAYGAQCWDLFAAYCMDLMGAGAGDCRTAGSGPHAGYAGSLYAGFPTTTWIARHFDRIPASQPGLKGDVIIWAADAYHPVTHVAILLDDVQPGQSPLVLAQNAGVTQNARRMWETPATYGYLRPKDRDYITGNTNSQENRMQCIIQPNGENYLVWFDGTKCHPHPPRPGDHPPDGRQADPRPRTALLQARLQDRPMVHAPASGSRTGVRRPRPAL